MANYGEELGYWYLRLNGFFPITNFVFHSLSSETRKARYNADADLLAIRPPNVSEVLMEETLKWDDKIISDHDQSKFVFVYCEVKTGEYDASKLFAEERIQYAKKRFGLSADYSSVERVFKTILIANEEKPNNLNRFKFISVDHIIEFIRSRFQDYDEVKYPSRMFFDSSLIQFLIHEARKKRRSRD